jgi:hypothetical protein
VGYDEYCVHDTRKHSSLGIPFLGPDDSNSSQDKTWLRLS